MSSFEYLLLELNDLDKLRLDLVSLKSLNDVSVD